MFVVVISLIAFLTAGTLLAVGLLEDDGGPSSAGRSRPTMLGSIALHECPDREAEDAGARCGSVPVPLDHVTNAGTLAIGFEWYPAAGTASGTVVAVEGGPGFSTTAARDGYLDLFSQLTDDRNVLLVDLRGTGTSGALRCERLEKFSTNEEDTDYLGAVADCGRDLNERWRPASGPYLAGSELFTTANAARDLDLVLAALDVDKIDLFGQSYGTYFATTFAARYPHRLRSLVLDSAYEVVDLDPWYRSTVGALRDAYDDVCRSAAACAQAAPGSSWARIGQLARRLRDRPVEGTVRWPDGDFEQTVDAGVLSGLVGTAATDPTVYRELDAAARALLEHDDAAPLLRLTGIAGSYVPDDDPRTFSVGLYTAVICSDYPQLYDMAAAPGARDRKLTEVTDALDPRTFAPFTVDEWMNYTGGPYIDCLEWPSPSQDDVALTTGPPLLPGSVPALVLSGELDTLTPPAGGKHVAEQLGPSARWVEIGNMGHGTALWDQHECASRLVREFVEQPENVATLDTSCASELPEVRVVGACPRGVADASPAVAGAGNHADVDALRLASVATATVGDVLVQYWYVGNEGVGLRGGTFEITEEDTATRFDLRRLRFVRDAQVNGTTTWSGDGSVVARVTITGPGGTTGKLKITWNASGSRAEATVTGTVDGVKINATLPAP